MEGGNIGKGSSGFRMDHSFNWEITGLRSCPRRQGCKEQKGYVREFGDGGVTELKTRNKLIGTQHNNKNKLTRI